jgi:succinate dehydrogenase / fumarate reductase cytochrome b subunit
MTWLSSFLGSSIGRKAVMAVTGLVVFGFVLGHMAGNMLLYLGPHALNGYAERLHSMPALLWGARLTLLACTVLHVWAATVLTLTNWRARPVGYLERDSLAASYASRTMIWSGPLLGAFVAYHLAHFTLGSVHPHFVPGDVYQNVVSGFQVPLVSGFYVVAMLGLGLHLYHGVWSMLQSLGLNHPRFNTARKVAAALFALALVLGNISFPLAVLAGLVR